MATLPKPKIPPLIRRSLLVTALSVTGCSDDGPTPIDAMTPPDSEIIAPQPPPADAMTPDAALTPDALAPQPPPKDAGPDATMPPPPQPPPQPPPPKT